MCVLIAAPFFGCSDKLVATDCRSADCEESVERDHEFGRQTDK
jgi:hypothetical protein